MRALVVGLLLAAALPGLAEACGVCFGAEDSAMTTGLNNGILTLLGIIGLIILAV